MRAPWPAGFERIPHEEDWTRQPVDSLATKYDSVERHGWYDNLDPTVDEIRALLREGDLVVDYSGGTGILIGRLLAKTPGRGFGIANVDSSPKFLRLCLDKFRDEPRVAFRLLRYLKDQKRLQFLDEVVPPLVGRVDAIVSANAIHLYYDLHDTLLGWRRTVQPEGRVLVQSGNIVHPDPRGMIIDDTVAAIHQEAQRLVRAQDRWRAHRPALDDAARMKAHDDLRHKFFLPPRPLAFYQDELARAGFRVESVRTRRVIAKTSEWLDFLKVYHEGVLGWVGGSERVEGHGPSEDALRDRLALMEEALGNVLGGRDHFDASWTYLTARPA